MGHVGTSSSWNMFKGYWNTSRHAYATHTYIYIYTHSCSYLRKKNIVGIKVVVELIGISWDTRSVLGIWLE